VTCHANPIDDIRDAIEAAWSVPINPDHVFVSPEVKEKLLKVSTGAIQQESSLPILNRHERRKLAAEMRSKRPSRA
jgi:hypothetical protein